ncbi:MAG TPA: HAD hydrolase-like protein [Candidatus Paceibacterota bacterium]
MASAYGGAVIFDGDGVIWDTVGLHDEISRQCAKEFGIEEFDIHSQDISGIFISAGLPATAYQKYLDIFSAHEKNHGVFTFPFVNEVLRELRGRGYLTGVFSNRKMRRHNHEMFFGSGLDYDLLNFIMLPVASGPESEVNPKSFHSVYISTNFSKPCGFAAFPLYELIQEIPGAPWSVHYIGDNSIDLEFSKRANFSFKAVLSGLIKTRDAWMKLGVKVSAIVPDIRNLLDILPLSGRT